MEFWGRNTINRCTWEELMREFVQADVSDCANPALASQAIHKKPAHDAGGSNG
jgi:hypothetical protein